MWEIFSVILKDFWFVFSIHNINVETEKNGTKKVSLINIKARDRREMITKKTPKKSLNGDNYYIVPRVNSFMNGYF